MRVPRPPVLLLVLAVFSAVVVATPLLYLGVRAFGAGWEQLVDIATRARTIDLAANSLLLALTVAVSCLVIGVPSAVLITRARLPLPGLWRVLVALPLAMPSYVAAYAWVDLFPQMNGFFGAWLVLTLVSTPYVTLPVAAALRRADRSVEEVARTLGRSSAGAMRAALLPQVLPAAAAGALLAALYALADFGAVAIMRFEVFTYGIQRAYRVGFDPALAAVLALLLTLLAVVLVLAERGARGRWNRRQPTTISARPSPTEPLRRWRLPALGGLTTVATLSLGVPLWSLTGRLLESTRSGVDWATLFSATLSTLSVSALGAALTIALALPVGVLAARHRGKSVAAIESVSYLGNALPGIVVGLAMVFLTIQLAPALYQTVLALGVAYAVMFLPKAVGAVRTSVGMVPVALEEVGRTLGRTPLAAWWSLTARLATPGIATGALLVMLTAMKELPATLLLRPLGMETLATQMWSHTAVNAYGAAAPYAFAVVLLASLPAYLLAREERAT